MRAIRQRVATLPFDAVIGSYVVASGTASFLGWGTSPLELVLHGAAVTAFRALYVAGGLTTLIGVCAEWRNADAAGLLLLGTGFLARLVALFAAAGLVPTSVPSLIFYVAMAAGCALRLVSLVAGDVVLIGRTTPEYREAHRG